MKRNQILGELFEIFILKLVLMSGYKLIDSYDVEENKIRNNRKRFIEFKGRGEYHQIDIPVDLDYRPNFIYPIRLLGEVKYRSKKIEKSLIRQEIGKMKDIQENYIVDGELTFDMRRKRRNEVFAFFSSSGFEDPAERLAYAHGIRTVSYENNKCVKNIVDYIRDISKNIALLNEKEQSDIIDKIFDVLILGKSSCIDFEKLPPTSKPIKLLPIKTSFIATTSTGLSINFLSHEEFPDYLFEGRDYCYCKYQSNNSLDSWHMTMSDCKAKFYFSLPEIIKNDSFEKNGNFIFPKKELELSSLSFIRKINGKQRNLELKFDNEWFNQFFDKNN